MEAENDLPYAEPLGEWGWPTSAQNPTTCNPTATIYTDSDSAYSQGSASPGLPSTSSPETIYLWHYEESPTIPADNAMFLAQPSLPSFDLPINDDDEFNALLEEVVPPSSFDDLVDWSASSASGASPPSTENYYPSPNAANMPTSSTGNSPVSIPYAPASLPTLQPMTSTAISQQPTAPYTCPESGCGKGFYKPCDLRKHGQKHSRPHRCGICLAFSSAELRGLQRHYWSRHKEWAEENRIPKQIAKCSFSGCKYEGRLDNLSRHMRRHSKHKDKLKRRR